MIGALVGAGLSAAGSIFGAIQGAKAARKERRMTQEALRDNEAWFNRRYNEDATQRADAQRLIEMTREQIAQRNRVAAGRNAVIGGTEEGVAATAEAGAKQMADVTTGIQANAEAQKNNIEAQYMARRDALNERLRGIQAQRAQNIAQATTGLLGAAGSIAGGLSAAEEAKAERSHQLKIMETLKGMSS